MKTAITGGIGSGKSYVCRLLRERGIDVYDCDSAAKRLMSTDSALRRALTELIGSDTYDTATGRLNKAAVARFLLKDEANKHAVNRAVHPAVARDFADSGMEWLESAILFESGFDRRIRFDHIICVAAPVEIRIERVCRRDSISREQALQWINSQMSQEEKMAKSSLVICNDGQQNLNKQINDILNKLNIN